ncbi:uncharacterized protein [Nicotiana tomentosiformis]|uniref:uncharacterized protein n=1 Tax=Nicotiana tomentosiformis TaxID=4098 RepID=UPI00388CAB7D
MESDSICYVHKCHQCQIHGDFIRVPPNKLNVMGSPWSFAAWGMDMIGPIEPDASNGHHFILVAIDYFTKWVEASTYKVVTKKVSWSQTANAKKAYCKLQTEQISQRGTPSKQESKLQRYEG